jgi:hypothetical protein
MAFNRGSIQTFKQERISKEDISLLIECVRIARAIPEQIGEYATDTRIELLLDKLMRMEKQK